MKSKTLGTLIFIATCVIMYAVVDRIMKKITGESITQKISKFFRSVFGSLTPPDKQQKLDESENQFWVKNLKWKLKL